MQGQSGHHLELDYPEAPLEKILVARTLVVRESVRIGVFGEYREFPQGYQRLRSGTWPTGNANPDLWIPVMPICRSLETLGLFRLKIPRSFE